MEEKKTRHPAQGTTVKREPVGSNSVTVVPVTSDPVRCEKLKVLDAVARFMPIKFDGESHKDCPTNNVPSNDLIYSLCKVHDQATFSKGESVSY